MHGKTLIAILALITGFGCFLSGLWFSIGGPYETARVLFIAGMLSFLLAMFVLLGLKRTSSDK